MNIPRLRQQSVEATSFQGRCHGLQLASHMTFGMQQDKGAVTIGRGLSDLG